MSHPGGSRLYGAVNSLAAEAAVHDFVFISDVAPHAGRGGEGALTFVAGELLQKLNVIEKNSMTISVHF